MSITKSKSDLGISIYGNTVIITVICDDDIKQSVHTLINRNEIEDMATNDDWVFDPKTPENTDE